ncbi:glycosyltransferase family 4 protein [Hymenobacter sp. HDW8]|uniref:glycosyltransferase family 4 protein n=1 Tax=Hymenobacter sp. HDW8 TaxID=2714932 RepID=UPI00196A3803|nr:glycosyltransferase family 4 protein [Hymenobacter sp. HDW8]
MNILFITHRFYPDVGGIEVNSEILALAFHQAGHAVHVVTWTQRPGDKSFPYVVLRNPSLPALLKQHQWADVVYENNPSLRLSWPALLFHKPSVVAIRTWITRTDNEIAWQDKLKQRWLQRAAAVIAVSEAVRKKSWPAATVIGNPYRVALFRIMPEVARTRSFVFLGRLVSDKGADLAIQAIAQLKTTMTQSSTPLLTIVGDGPDRALLEALALSLEVKDQVVFMGALEGEKLVVCLNQHQFLLVPSRWEEPFGNVALEGMACGCIPIVSDGGGLPDAVGEAGLCFPRGSVEGLLDCMRSVVQNPARAQQLRAAAAAHLAAHHPALVGGKYLQVIEQALKK